VDAPALDAGHSTFDAPQPNGLLVPPRDIPAAARVLVFDSEFGGKKTNWRSCLGKKS